MRLNVRRTRCINIARRSFKCFPRALKSSLLPLLSANPLPLNYSRILFLSLYLPPRVASKRIVVCFYKNVVFGLFRRPRLYKWDRGKRSCCEVASSDTRYRIVYISEGNQFDSAGLSTCPLNNLRARRYARPACATTTVESTNKISDDVAPRVSDKFLSLARRRGSIWSAADLRSM